LRKTYKLDVVYSYVYGRALEEEIMENALERFRQEHRPQIQAALQEARRELAELEERRQELLGEIEAAASWLGGAGSGPERDPELGSSGRLTLHGAMQAVLREHPEGLPVPELAAEIEKRDLYRRRDNLAPGPHQVHARVHNYPQLFHRQNGRIHLRED
jgi:hypothetical protein